MASLINTSRIAIVGLGQLGASLAMKCKQIGCISLFAIARNDDTIQSALDNDLIDAGSTLAADILPVVDIVFICLPLTATIEFVRQNIKDFRPGSLVTDVGSVKEVIVNNLRPILHQHGAYFIGGHPMAGSEKSGMNARRIDLFQDAIVFLTPTPDDDSSAINILRNFWSDIGACPLEIDARRHDQAVAYSSHYLHLVAATLCKTTLSHGDSETQSLACAGGFRDTTRIASSNARMWEEIFKYNREFTLKALDDFCQEIAMIRDQLKTEDWQGLVTNLEDANKLRQDWYDNFGKARGFRSSI